MTKPTVGYEWLRREHGMCAVASPDGQRLCIMEPDHDGAHGWEADHGMTAMDVLNYAWTIICNVSEGDWTKQLPKWREAAIRLREQYHALLDEMRDPHDHKGYSEEKCVRCGWVMGQPPLNCQNDDTPHRFPSQGEA